MDPAIGSRTLHREREVEEGSLPPPPAHHVWIIRKPLLDLDLQPEMHAGDGDSRAWAQVLTFLARDVGRRCLAGDTQDGRHLSEPGATIGPNRPVRTPVA